MSLDIYENRPKAYITQDIAMKYLDSRGRYHDSPVTQSNPFPSNNGWIYTAYMARVEVEVSQTLTTLVNVDKSTALTCSNLNIRHLPEDKVSNAPMSRDEILGLAYLGYVSKDLTETWRFNPSDRPIPKFSLTKLIKQAQHLVIVNTYYKRVLGFDIKMFNFELAHRNFFWKNNLDQLYRFAFSVPIQDRYSILKWSNRFKFYRPDHLFYAGISLVDRLGMPSGMRYLKYGGYDNMEAMVKEFPSDHPIVKFYDRT